MRGPIPPMRGDVAVLAESKTFQTVRALSSESDYDDQESDLEVGDLHSPPTF